jgi:hypothetical protein
MIRRRGTHCASGAFRRISGILRRLTHSARRARGAVCFLPPIFSFLVLPWYFPLISVFAKRHAGVEIFYENRPAKSLLHEFNTFFLFCK